VIPHSHSDLEPVQEALQALSRTDPSVRIENQEGQILVHGLGALHLEIVEGRLKDEWGARLEFGRRRVGYREGLGSMSQHAVSNSWQTDLGGTPITIKISLSVKSITDSEKGDPAWDGNVVVNEAGVAIPAPAASTDHPSPLASIARGIANTLSNSPQTSLPMSHVHVQVNSFSHPSNATPSILTGAAAVIMRNHIRAAGMGPIMEPYVDLKVSVNEDSLGKVIKDLTENGGEMQDLESGFSSATDYGDSSGGYSAMGVYDPPDWLSPSCSSFVTTKSATSKRSISARAPLNKTLDYSNRLRALSGGHGAFEMANAGFRIVSEARKLEILREIGRA
jgi:elongation factor G